MTKRGVPDNALSLSLRAEGVAISARYGRASHDKEAVRSTCKGLFPPKTALRVLHKYIEGC